MCILLRANVFIIVEILPWRALDTREKEPASRHPSSSACACAGGYVTHWERDLVSLDSRRCLGIRVHAHPLRLHWVPMLCFSLLVRKTVSHLRITNTMGRTNRKVFLRSWNWPRSGQGCKHMPVSAAQKAFVEGSYAEFIYRQAVPCVPMPSFSLGHGLVISCSHTLPTHKALTVIF